MLAFLGPVLARRALRRRPRGPPAAARASSWPTGRREPDVLARMEALGRAQPGPGRPPGLLRRRRGLRPRDPVGDPGPGRPLRVRDLLHAVPARGGPGRAAGRLRVPDHGRPPGRAAGGQRLALRRGQRRGRGRQPGRGGLGPPDGVGVRPASTPTGARCWPPSPPGTGHRLVDRPAGRRRDRLARGRRRPRPSRPACWWSATRTISAASRTSAAARAHLRPHRGPAGRGGRPGGRRAPAVAGGVGRRRGGGGGPGLRHRPRASAAPTSGCSPAPSTTSAACPGRLVGETVDVEGTPGLRHHPAGPRAGHPAGEGHVQRLHQPDPDGGDRGRPAGLAGHVGSAPSWPCAAPGPPATPATRCWPSTGWRPSPDRPGPARVRRPRCPCRPPWSSSGWPTRASWPAIAARRRRIADGRARPAGRGDRAPDPRRDRRLRAPPWTRRWRDDRGRRPMPASGGAGGKATSAPLLGRDAEPTLFELSQPGRQALVVPDHRASPRWPSTSWSPRRTGAPSRSPLAEVSERDLVAHFTRLVPPAVLGRPRRLPARLVHHEVQPQGVRHRGRPARAGRRPPGRAGLADPGLAGSCWSSSRRPCARSPAWPPPPCSRRPGPPAS